MMQRKDFVFHVDGINFEKGPGNRQGISGGNDVSLTINAAGIRSNGEQRYCRVIRFYGDVEKKICGDSSYITVGTDERNSRVYFKRADLRSGYKLTKTNNKAKYSAKMIRSTPDNILFWWNIEGDYDLRYDKERGLYYIDISEAKEGKA